MSNAFQYQIQGSDLQFVELLLPPGGTAVSEPGAMMFLDEGITMDTRLGDGSQQNVFSRLGGAFARAFSGESLFTVVYTNTTAQPLRVAFAAPLPGKIMPVDLAANGGTVICQKGAFLGGTQGVKIGIALKKRIRVGFFGGEGFIMQKLTGSGLAFIHATGTLTEQVLAPGQAMKVDTGCLAALQTSVTYDIRMAGKIKTALFGGEGLFLAYLKGPGTVWLQSLPVKRLSAGLMVYPMGRQGGSALGKLYVIGIVLFVLWSFYAARREAAEDYRDEPAVEQQQ